MGGGTGTGPESLEEKAVEIIVHGDLQKIVQILGSVKSVSGFNKDLESLYSNQKVLYINLNPKTSTKKNYVGLLKFQGSSPVRGGDIIKAGLSLGSYSEESGGGYILYLGILKKDGSFGRIDYEDGYNPMHDDARRLGLC